MSLNGVGSATSSDEKRLPLWMLAIKYAFDQGRTAYLIRKDLSFGKPAHIFAISSNRSNRFLEISSSSIPGCLEEPVFNSSKVSYWDIFGGSTRHHSLYR